MATLLPHPNIVFVGAGSIAEAIIRGMLERKRTAPDRIFAVNRHNRERLRELNERYGIRVPDGEADRDRFIRDAEIVVLAMKPKDAAGSLLDLKPLLNETQLIVSVIAGLSVATIAELLSPAFGIVRTMPNTSSTIGLGATGISFSDNVADERKTAAIGMFEAIGIVREVREEQLDIVTGVSGSRPAYVYYMMEAMIAAGVERGLSPETARELTVQTVLGAAGMVRGTGEEPSVLRRKVTSPGGTTQAAIETLDAHQFGAGIGAAVRRAEQRAGEMGAAIAAQAKELKSQ